MCSNIWQLIELDVAAYRKLAFLPGIRSPHYITYFNIRIWRHGINLCDIVRWYGKVNAISTGLTVYPATH